MSLLKTKPTWFPAAVATERGWCNPITGEVLVSHGNLKAKLAAETALAAPVVEEKPAKKKKLVEQTVVTPAPTQVVLGEVVEIKLQDGTSEITE